MPPTCTAPPAGGGNTGIQDVHGLAWRLSLVLRGLAGEQLLDTYGAERHAVAAQILRLTKLQDDWLFGARTAGARLARNAGVRGLSRAGIFESRVVPDLAQLTLAYRRSPLTVGAAPRGVRRYRPGHRMPDVAVLPSTTGASAGLREACAGAGIVLVLVPGPGEARAGRSDGRARGPGRAVPALRPVHAAHLAAAGRRHRAGRRVSAGAAG